MYGLTRGTVTLICAAVAGFLIWLATQVSDSSNGGYWGVYGLIAAAGLVMAFSQLLGGWTKWGWPRLSVNVLLIGFIPVLIAAGWVLLATQPDPNWFRDHIRSWTDDTGGSRPASGSATRSARSSCACSSLRWPGISAGRRAAADCVAHPSRTPPPAGTRGSTSRRRR